MSAEAKAWAVMGGLLVIAYAWGLYCGRVQGRVRLAKKLQRDGLSEAASRAERVQRWVRPPVPVTWDGSRFSLVSAYEDAVAGAAQYRSRVAYSTDAEAAHVAVAQQLDLQAARLRAEVLLAFGEDPTRVSRLLDQAEQT